MIVRRASTADVPAIAAISLAAGQPATDSGADPPYTALLLAHGVVAVAEDGAGVVGWGATGRTPVGDLLTDLFVDPRHQGRGAGGALLGELWPGAPSAPRRFTFSSRHPAALPLYARAGLAPIWPLLYLTGSPRRLPGPLDLRARLVSADEAAEADAALTGAPARTADYRYWAGGTAGSALLVLDGERLVAAGAGDPARLAHLTCRDASVAAAALTAALLELGADSTTVCLPGPHPGLADLLRRGWRVEDHDLAMCTPDTRLPTVWVYSPGLG